MESRHQADWTEALRRARTYSPFLSQAMDRLPELVAVLESGDGEAALALARRAGEGSEDVGIALRRERLALALALGIGDLAGAFPLLRITGELSRFADRALDTAIAHGIRRRAPDAQPTGFLALALGKHGAGELNYSSDIDPILLYDPETLPRRARDEPGEAAQRVARAVVETLSGVTAEGYVFRVDLRLRPASEVSPLAISLGAALTHYESSALTWERAAFIRARACAGDIAQGEEFLTAIRPFIWRKSLDFGAIAEVGRLTRQIRASTTGTEAVGPGFNLKKGRGGIREIEFFAQTHQLIHGGRNPSLRLKGTRETLDALAAAGLIDPDVAVRLGESYDRLRTIEHRLQMVADRQTHSLPENEQALDGVAALDGMDSGAALIAEVDAITQVVGAHYDRLVADSTPSGSDVPTRGEGLETALDRIGFADPASVASRIAAWRSGKTRALRSEAALRAFEAIEPDLLAALATAPEPERALARWESLLNNLPSAINLFHLLEARPGLLDRLAAILSLAPPLADELARRADLLDPLIDASALDLPGSVADLATQFSRFEPHSEYEQKLDWVRRKVGELRFALGVQVIEGVHDPLAIGAALARVAEAALVVLTRAAAEEFQGTHGVIPGSEMLILALGRFGGGVLTHASDLDVVLLFSGDPTDESDGERPLGPTLYFNRLSQRAIAALSVPTAEGALFEIDTRLRPSGAQGPPAASLASFERYQCEQAWTWEHMALTRARAVYGSDEGRAALDTLVRSILRHARDGSDLKARVLDMRETMAQHKPRRGLLDVKLARGGLVDLEFIVHYLQLRDGIALVPDLGEAVRLLGEAKRLDPALVGAHDTLTRVLIAARLLAPDCAAPSASARAALAKACLERDWDKLLAHLTGARTRIAAAWRDTFGQDLEVDE